MPLTLLLLLIVFGSVVAALLPLAIGTIAITGTFAELALLGGVVDVSVSATNLTTALGLGLGIDYALLMISRFREQLATGSTVDDAVRHTVHTATARSPSRPPRWPSRSRRCWSSRSTSSAPSATPGSASSPSPPSARSS